MKLGADKRWELYVIVGFVLLAMTLLLGASVSALLIGDPIAWLILGIAGFVVACFAIGYMAVVSIESLFGEETFQ